MVSKHQLYNFENVLCSFLVFLKQSKLLLSSDRIITMLSLPCSLQIGLLERENKEVTEKEDESSEMLRSSQMYCKGLETKVT